VASAKATTALVKCDSVSLEQVKSFHYLGSIMSDMCDCRVEITAKPAMARSAAKSLMSLWKDCWLNFQLKSRLMQTLVWTVAMYVPCESWTIKAVEWTDSRRFKMDMYRRMMQISWTEHRTNNSILEELQLTRCFLAEVKRRKLQYFGHAVRADNLCTHVLHGTIAGNRHRGRPRRRWTDDIKQWTSAWVAECVQCACDRNRWSALVSVSATSSVMRKDQSKARQLWKI